MRRRVGSLVSPSRPGSTRWPVIEHNETWAGGSADREGGCAADHGGCRDERRQRVAGFPGWPGIRRAYPPLEKLQISFEEMAQPHWFAEKPEMAWAFYGHRQQLYRETKPHMGYWMLRDWARAVPAGHFVVTSNVDGAFDAAGLARRADSRAARQHPSVPVHGAVRPSAIWTDDPPNLQIDLDDPAGARPVATCPACGALARPNVLMFGDFAWVADAMEEQRRRYQQWLASVRGKQLVIIEVGAGTALATIRWFGEKLTASGRGRPWCGSTRTRATRTSRRFRCE